MPTGRATCSNCTNFSPDASRVTPPSVCEKLGQLRKVASPNEWKKILGGGPVEDFFVWNIFLYVQKKNSFIWCIVYYCSVHCSSTLHTTLHKSANRASYLQQLYQLFTDRKSCNTSIHLRIIEAVAQSSSPGWHFWGRSMCVQCATAHCTHL